MLLDSYVCAAVACAAGLVVHLAAVVRCSEQRWEKVRAQPTCWQRVAVECMYVCGPAAMLLNSKVCGAVAWAAWQVVHMDAKQMSSKAGSEAQVMHIYLWISWHASECSYLVADLQGSCQPGDPPCHVNSKALHTMNTQLCSKEKMCAS